MRTAHRMGSFAPTVCAIGGVRVGVVFGAAIAGGLLGVSGGCRRSPERSATLAVVRAVERLGGKATVAPPALAAPRPASPGTPPAAGSAGPSAGLVEKIMRIDLAHTRVTDADLAALAGGAGEPLAAVEEIDLTHTSVGDAGVAALGAFPAVRKLSLTLTRVGDAGLAPLASLGRLAELYLAETSLTDDAVPALERLAGLRVLVLLRTGLSDAGIARLRRALPEATIQVEPAAARRRRSRQP